MATRRPTCGRCGASGAGRTAAERRRSRWGTRPTRRAAWHRAHGRGGGQGARRLTGRGAAVPDHCSSSERQTNDGAAAAGCCLPHVMRMLGATHGSGLVRGNQLLEIRRAGRPPPSRAHLAYVGQHPAAHDRNQRVRPHRVAFGPTQPSPITGPQRRVRPHPAARAAADIQATIPGWPPTGTTAPPSQAQRSQRSERSAAYHSRKRPIVPSAPDIALREKGGNPLRARATAEDP